ncbi:ABC transporter substrate-binding protein [Jiangella asiatica]|uniref:Carbohydrate ABC transporter substrate-binding protein n=1 Tax=Jiangella asiatica TaxID=2530372 RepID=A0A4R5D732_9ACTN|nr:ABC transporter substrate-binding protein [Jiangella asiatica]TDE09289.1 carbohydrate ABC transporter substrate-binding protein [Jiangella asiatica]
MSRLARSACALALGGTAVLIAAACSPPSPQLGNNNPNSESGPIELRFWTNLTVDEQAGVIEEQARSCVAGLDDVSIEFEAVPFDSMYARMVTAFRGGEGPDIMNTIEGAVSFGQAGGYLTPVDDVVDAHGRADFVPSFLHAASKDGQVWAVPDWALHQEVWYRTDLFESAGVDVPTSWPELLEVARAVDRVDGETRGFAVPLGAALVAPQTYYQFLYANGVYTFDPETGEYAFDRDRDAAVEATQYMLDLYAAASPPEARTWGWNEFRTAFAGGDLAMVMDFGAVVGMAVEQNPELLDHISSFPLPPPVSGAEPGGILGGGYYYMVGASNPRREAAAKEVVGCLLQPDLVAERTNTRPVFALPATRSAAESPTYTSNPMVQRFAAEIETIREVELPRWYRYGMEAGLNPLAGQIEATTFIGDHLQSAATGRITAAEAVDAIDADLRRLIREQ